MNEPIVPQRQPWITLSFFDDGAVTSAAGPGRFPTEPIDINRTLGAVMIILWQIAQSGYERMLKKAQHNYSIQEYLRQMPPASDKEM